MAAAETDSRMGAAEERALVGRAQSVRGSFIPDSRC
jgi:hypothetical protein